MSTEILHPLGCMPPPGAAHGQLPLEPKHVDALAEVEWLRSQIIRLQGTCNFQTERLRIRQDWADAERELRELHARRNEDLTKENDWLQVALAKARAQLANQAKIETNAGTAVTDAPLQPRPAMSAEEHNAHPKGRWV